MVGIQRTQVISRALLVGLVVGVGMLAGSLVARPGSADSRLQPAEVSNVPGVFMMDDPLGGAELVTRDVAETTLSARSTGWATIPAGSDVTQAWVREDGYVAFEFENGLTLIYQPDDRSEAEFVESFKEMAETEGPAWSFSLIPLRGTQAEATDIHGVTLLEEGTQRGPGPAAVTWIEGGYVVSLYGGPSATATGLKLSELLEFAEAMG